MGPFFSFPCTECGVLKSKKKMSKGVRKGKNFVSKGVWKEKNFVSKGVWKGNNCVYNGALICQKYYVYSTPQISESVPFLFSPSFSLLHFPFSSSSYICGGKKRLSPPPPPPPPSLPPSVSASLSPSLSPLPTPLPAKRAWKKDRGKRAPSLKRALSVATIPKRGWLCRQMCFFFSRESDRAYV